MQIITVDFETYYDKQYSLSRMTTEEYINDSRFQIIGVGVKVGTGETEWLSGPHDRLQKYLQKNYDWENSAVLAHNTLFDGAIMGWKLGINPKLWLDTLAMGRALHGENVGGSLRRLSEMYKLGEKGTTVEDAINKRREDFTEDELAEYGDYCVQDVELTAMLFTKMMPHFPPEELKVIDTTLRMFIEPVLVLDTDRLRDHADKVSGVKLELLKDLGITRGDVMSNEKFAELLRVEGVEPPTKTSLRTGKTTLALAKSDKEFNALKSHHNVRVQKLVNARLANKSTLEVTRAERMVGIAERNAGLFPVPLKYYAAHTGRWGGYDKVNVQNFPSRSKEGKTLKACIRAPKGYILVDADSKQIEARTLAWLAGQHDLTAAFKNGEDVYVKMAARIYGVPIDQVTPEQRFVGKQTVLGCGYGMGAVRFREQLRTMGVDIPEKEAKRIIRIYRETNEAIVELWAQANKVLNGMEDGTPFVLGWPDVLSVSVADNSIVLPNGLRLKYDNLRSHAGEYGREFTYDTRNGPTKIYGGKVIENACQAISRIAIAEQMVKIKKRERVALTVHDSVVCCVKRKGADKTSIPYIAECMRYIPEWAKGLPLDCDIAIGKDYGNTVEISV